MSLSQEGSCTSGGPEGRWTIEVGASVGAIGRDGAPPGEVRAVERDRGDGDALAVWQAGQHLAGRARDAAPAEAPELPLASDAIGHRHEGDVLQGARGREALRRPAVPAPHGALVVIGDPVGAVDDEVGAEVDQAANEVRKDQVVADRHTDAPERGVDHERRIARSEEHTSELQSPCNLVCRLLLEKKKELIRIPVPARLTWPLLIKRHNHASLNRSMLYFFA